MGREPGTRGRSAAALIVIGLTALALAACTGGSEAAKPAASAAGGQLEGPVWVLQSYRNLGTFARVPEGSLADARIAGGTINGFSGCNVFTAPYDVFGSNLQVGLVGSTTAQCDAVDMDLEAAYLGDLRNAAAYTATGDALTVFDAGGAAILLYVPAQPRTLTGQSWALALYADANGNVVVPVSGTAATATFGSDGTVSGNTTCNSYAGTYSTKDSSLTVALGPMTSMACAAEDQQAQEAVFVKDLLAAASYVAWGKHLEIRDATGRIVLVFGAP